MRSLILDVTAGIRFAAGIPFFLREKITADEARRIRAERLRRREENFLRIVQGKVFDNPSSPYLALFREAGCEYGDLVRLLQADGLEATLQKLLQEGVYLTVEELKGRRELRRRGGAVPCGPGLLRNPGITSGLSAKTGGSRSQGTPLLLDFRFIGDCAVNTCLYLDALGGTDWVKADWEVPGGGALFRLLKFSRFGRPQDRWFSQLDPSAAGLHPRYRWSARAARWMSLVAASPLPPVQYVSLDRPAPIVRWMREVLEEKLTPFLFSFPSSAVRLALAASELGISLKGAVCLLGGEPLTEARLKTIRESGALPLPRYGSIECGPISYGCLHPVESDDTHINRDLHAVIQAGPDGPPAGLPRQAIFLTGLSAWAPYVFLNVNLGDQAVLERRRCGCPADDEHLDGHLRRIRSFEKLTSAGMTFLDTDVIRILEHDLPARFGGAATDFQIVEEEDDQGRPVLNLLIHPRLGPVDTAAAAGFFLERIGGGSGVEKVMGRIWKEGRVVRVLRKPPVAGPTGKILHLKTAPRRR